MLPLVVLEIVEVVVVEGSMGGWVVEPPWTAGDLEREKGNNNFAPKVLHEGGFVYE